MPVPYLDDFINGLIIIGLLLFAILFFITYKITGSLKSSSIFWGVFLGVPFLILQGMIFHTKYENAQENKQYQEKQAAFLAKSIPYFENKCKSAGIFIYDKNIPSQESVYIMRPLSIGESYFLPSKNEVERQYVKHDFFNHWMSRSDATSAINTSIDGSPESLFYRSYGFSYVETYLEEPANLVRFEYLPDTREGRSGDRVFGHTSINKITSRYGVTWLDISTQEDREHWVTGGKRQIIDLHNNKVVAEVVGYAMAENPFIFNWKGIQICPKDYMANKFIWSVLRHKEYLEFEQNLIENKGK